MSAAKEYALRRAREMTVVHHRGGDETIAARTLRSLEKEGLVSVRWEDERHWAWFRLADKEDVSACRGYGLNNCLRRTGMRCDECAKAAL